MLVINCPTWYKAAPCSGHDRVFFSTHPTDRKEAKNICLRECPNIKECRNYAVENNITIGVWGGLTGPELSRLADDGTQVHKRR